MLSQKEEHQLKQYCDKDPRLSLLLEHLEDSHRMDLSRISHEIRNPVTIINSFLQLTQNNYPEVTTFGTWKPILENMEYLKQLLSEVSQYNNAAQLHKERISLTSFLQTLMSDCQITFPSIHFTFQKDSAIPSAFFDKVKLQAAILNIIRNASEAMEEQSIKKIHISLSFDGEYFYIKITNNGPCIPPEHIPRLFEPFVTHKKDGSGLGLAIVQSIVHAHNGYIMVFSNSNETSFTLCLPFTYKI